MDRTYQKRMVEFSAAKGLMTTNLKAIYEKGVLRLTEPLPVAEGSQVDITVTIPEGENGGNSSSMEDQSWDKLTQLLSECAVDTGIPDLARQHDHYLYGIPKK